MTRRSQLPAEPDSRVLYTTEDAPQFCKFLAQAFNLEWFQKDTRSATDKERELPEVCWAPDVWEIHKGGQR